MEAPIEIGASIREKGRMSSIGYLFGQLGLLVDGLNRLDRLGFLVGDLTGRELGFELLDDFGVHLLLTLKANIRRTPPSAAVALLIFFFSSKRVGAEITH